MRSLDPQSRARRLAAIGAVVNVVLAGVKLLAGLLGNSYALIADAIESFSDVAGSVIIWGGLKVSSRPATQSHPYGYGKAEALAALVVAMIIFVAGIGIAVESIFEIMTPHHSPAPWTLIVLVAVVVVKEFMFRKVRRAANDSGSNAVHTDAWHHRADAITSLAAFVGIMIAWLGGPGWEPADDWAALGASGLILFNAIKLANQPLRELLDAQTATLGPDVESIARSVPGVRVVEKVIARKSGTRYWIDMHLWVDANMPVRDAHEISHQVKDAIKAARPTVSDVLIHIEPDPPDARERHRPG